MFNRYALAATAGLAAFGAVAASAATLGGVSTKSLGVGNAVVGACDTDGVDAAYATSYNATAKAYRVTGVTLSGVAAACAGQTAKVTLSQAGTPLSEASAPVTGTTLTLTLPTPVNAEAVDNIAVLIAG